MILLHLTVAFLTAATLIVTCAVEMGIAASKRPSKKVVINPEPTPEPYRDTAQTPTYFAAPTQCTGPQCQQQQQQRQVTPTRRRIIRTR